MGKLFRRVAIVALCLPLLPGCNLSRGGDEVVPANADVGTGVGISTTTAPPDADPGITAVETNPTPDDSPAQAPGAGEEQRPVAKPAPASSGLAFDDRPVGDLASALLRGEVSGAVVEVDAVRGLSLTTETQTAIEQSLRTHGGKESVTFTTEDRVVEQDRYSLDELRVLAEQERRYRSGDGTVAMHVLVLSGQFETDQVAVAFASSSFAVFPDAIGRNTPYAQYAAAESQVVLHELGHLFGLVNIVGMGGFHEDPNHPGHSPNVDSVMHFEVDRGRSGPPALDQREFDDDDKREMRAIRQLALPEGFQ